MNSGSSSDTSFVFVVCHPSVTQWCRKEVSAIRPAWLPAFSRPGFLTYKVPERLAERFELPATFVRSFGISLQQVRSVNADALVTGIQRIIETLSPKHKVEKIHFWNRQWRSQHSREVDDASLPENECRFQSMAAALRDSFPVLTSGPATVTPESCVLDAIQIDTGHWALGYHFAGSIAQRWPGGVPEIVVPDEMISRAYLKTTESLLWSGIPIATGDICVEVGSSPGGSCQRLLELGAKVIAIDPADMHPTIAGHPDMTHVRKRGRDVSQRVLATGKWLFVDTNIAPTSTLAISESILCNKSSRFQGAIITLKMLDDELAESTAVHIERVQSWGFQFVKMRHLAFGRQELCLVALRQKGLRRKRKH